MYEVTLITGGVQQIGWCNLKTPFTHDVGCLPLASAGLPPPRPPAQKLTASVPGQPWARSHSDPSTASAMLRTRSPTTASACSAGTACRPATARGGLQATSLAASSTPVRARLCWLPRAIHARLVLTPLRFPAHAPPRTRARPWAASLGHENTDEGTVTFLRNGRSLGPAFTGIRTKLQGLVYFPAFSMSQNERSTVNLGDRPWQYPPEDPTYLPITQTRPPVAKLAYLLGCIDRLLPALQTAQGEAQLVDAQLGDLSARDAAFMCTTAVMRQAAPLVTQGLLDHPMLLFGPLLQALVR